MYGIFFNSSYLLLFQMLAVIYFFGKFLFLVDEMLFKCRYLHQKQNTVYE